MKPMYVLLLVPTLSWAQPMTFPDDAVPITAELFAERAVGKVFKGRRADGSDMQIDIAKDGTLTWYGSGNSDRGKWRIDGDKFCTDMRRIDSSCNEVRFKGDTLYYKRVSNGEVVTLTAK